MKSLHIFFWITLLTTTASSAHAADFATDSFRPWASRASSSYHSQRVPDAYLEQGYRAGSVRNSSYWVERDPRYTPALPKVARTTYRPSAYGPAAAYHPTLPANGWQGQRPFGPSSHYGQSVYRRPSNYGPAGYDRPAYRPEYGRAVSNGYYKGDGIFGKDTMFAKDQPIRNFFRYLMP